MLWIIIFLGSSIPIPSLSGDGSTLTITGDGTITQNIARSQGTYGSITKVIITAATVLDSKTFDQFKGMVSITLPSRMNSIGEGCFANCENLRNFSVPEGVTEIKQSTFYQCSNLEHFHVSSTVQSISTAFYRCYKLVNYSVSPDNSFFSTDSTQHFLLDKSGNTLYLSPALMYINIPQNPTIINSYFMYATSAIKIDFTNSNIQIIKPNAFAETSIDELKFPITLKRLEAPFKAATISIISIPETLEYFDENTLKEVNGLTKFDIGKNPNPKVFKIVDEIIYNSQQTKIYYVPSTQSNIPIMKTIKSIDFPMVRSPTIKSVSVEKDHSSYSSINGLLFNAAGKILLACPGGLDKVTIPSSCTEIAEYALFGITASEIVLNEGLTTLNQYGIANCLNIVKLTIPQSLKIIGKYLFMSVESPKLELRFGSNIEEIGVNAFVELKAKLLDLSKCTKITSLSSMVFRKTSLETLLLHQNIREIGIQAFINAKIQSPLSFPNVVSVGQMAFISSNISSISFEGSTINLFNDSIFEKSAITEFVLPDSVSTLKVSAFSECRNLLKFTISQRSSLKTIEASALSLCESLDDLYIPRDVNSIAYGAFSGCSSLKKFRVSTWNTVYSVDQKYGFLMTGGVNLHSFPGGQSQCSISQSIKEISPMAFLLCSKLWYVVFEQGCGISSIKESTFKGCSSLSKVDFMYATKLTELGDASFADCKALKRIEFGSALTKISSAAFSGCKSLRHIKLPAKISSIGSGAFAQCISLEQILFCGKSASGSILNDSKAVSFVGVPCQAVFVQYGYSGSVFCGIPILKYLDSDCNMPTGVFTVWNNSQQYMLLFNTMSLLSDK